ncbi:hypothetical protein C8R47DRAFT_1221762 [Mycena vitilis]|nr:hypothetical protein C8R47DRAFT_1221762 [Mycena vitilis]
MVNIFPSSSPSRSTVHRYRYSDIYGHPACYSISAVGSYCLAVALDFVFLSLADTIGFSRPTRHLVRTPPLGINHHQTTTNVVPPRSIQALNLPGFTLHPTAASSSFVVVNSNAYLQCIEFISFKACLGFTRTFLRKYDSHWLLNTETIVNLDQLRPPGLSHTRSDLFIHIQGATTLIRTPSTYVLGLDWDWSLVGLTDDFNLASDEFNLTRPGLDLPGGVIFELSELYSYSTSTPSPWSWLIVASVSCLSLHAFNVLVLTLTSNPTGPFAVKANSTSTRRKFKHQLSTRIVLLEALVLGPNIRSACIYSSFEFKLQLNSDSNPSRELSGLDAAFNHSDILFCFVQRYFCISRSQDLEPARSASSRTRYTIHPISIKLHLPTNPSFFLSPNPALPDFAQSTHIHHPPSAIHHPPSNPQHLTLTPATPHHPLAPLNPQPSSCIPTDEGTHLLLIHSIRFDLGLS